MKGEIVFLPLDRIYPSPTNPRKHFDQEKLSELSGSIKEHGVIQPILVRPMNTLCYELVAGERRYRASLVAELTIIPAFVKEMSDQQVLEVQVIENMQRDDLHPLEEAEGYEKLMKDYNYSAELLAEKVGKSKAYIYAKLKLTALCPEARDAFYEGLHESAALLLARIPVAALQLSALKEITAPRWGGESMSVREAARHIQNNYMLHIDKAPFKTADESLLAGAGSCRKCPKLAANQPEIFADLKNADVCTDPECYARKKQANIDSKVLEAEAKGLNLIHGDAARKLFPHGVECSRTYVPLDTKNWQSPAGQTYRELLVGEMPTVTLVEDFDKGALVECVATAELTKILKAKRIESPFNQGSRNNDEEKKAREESAFRANWLQEIRLAFAKDLSERSLPLFPTLNSPELKMVAKTLFGAIDFETQKRLLTYWFEEKISHDFVYEFERELIDTLPDQSVCALLIDCCLIGEARVATYWTPKTERMESLAERYGIDHKRLKKEMSAAAKARDAAKAAKSAKKSPTARKAA